MHHILFGNPFIPRNFYAIRPPHLWHILGACVVANMGGGVVKIIFKLLHSQWTRPFWGTDCQRSPKSLSSAQAASLCSAGIKRSRKCLQGGHFVICCHSGYVRPHSTAGVGGGRGGTHTGTHTHTHTQERTRECCTYPLATYPLKSAR